MRSNLISVATPVLIVVACLAVLPPDPLAHGSANANSSVSSQAHASMRIRAANLRAERAFNQIALAELQARFARVMTALEHSANALNREAHRALAEGDDDTGIELLRREATALSEALRGDDAGKESIAERWSWVGVAAFLKDPPTAITAYENMLRFDPGSVEALSRLAFLYLRTGDMSRRAVVVKQLASSSDPEGRVQGLLHQGYWSQQRGNLDESLTYYETALELADGSGLLREAALIRVLLASNLLARGELERAGAIAKEAREISRSGGYVYEEAGSAYQLGVVAQYAGRGHRSIGKRQAKRADDYYTEAALLYQEVLAEWEVADVLAQRARLKYERFELEEAVRLGQDALRLAESTGNVYAEAAAHRALGTAYSIEHGRWKPNPGLSNAHFELGVAAIHDRGFEHMEAVILAEWAMALFRFKWFRAACSAAKRAQRLHDLHLRGESPETAKIIRSRVELLCR